MRNLLKCHACVLNDTTKITKFTRLQTSQDEVLIRISTNQLNNFLNKKFHQTIGVFNSVGNWTNWILIVFIVLVPIRPLKQLDNWT